MNKFNKKSIPFDIFNVILMCVVCFVTIYPFLYLLSLSFSSGDVPLTRIYLIPPKFTFDNMAKVFANEYIGLGFKNTLIRMVLGTSMAMLMTILGAYVLSKKYFPHRAFWTSFVVFTMFFSGGLVPTYLWIRTLGLNNTVWALVLPGLINTYNMIIARNFFMSLPESVEESARIDGANDIYILFRIIIPMSMPIIATLFLWISVGHWNAWFDSMIYIREARSQVLQVVMRRIVLEGTIHVMNMNTGADEDIIVNPETLKAATIIVTTIPIVMVYPFIQKYFVKGVMVGSLKG